MGVALILDVASVFFAGLLGGMELALHYGVRTPSEVLDDTSQLRLRMALVMRFRVIIPALFLPAIVFAVAGFLLDSGGPGEWFRIAGIVALVAWIGIRVVGTVPINSATVEWSIEAPPSDWKERVRHAERFHDVGVWAVVFAFACFLVAVVLA
jgi:hypothetical protein